METESGNLKELLSKPAKSLSEVMPAGNMWGERVDAEDIENKELRIVDYEVIASNKFKEGGRFGVIRAIVDDKVVVCTVSETVAGQLDRIGHENLPVIAKLAKKKSAKGFQYWSLESTEKEASSNG